MTDDRRMTTDRFYGGVSNRLQNLRSMLVYVRDEHPTREGLNRWVIDNTRAGSPDDVRNGVALCKLHHWAFDTGWLTISDDYEILVQDASERDGYDEFTQLKGDTLDLPDNHKARPHRMFLERHRAIHGF